MIERIAIVGTGLIGASTGLALRRAGFKGEITGVDRSTDEGAEALHVGAVDRFLLVDDFIAQAAVFDAVVLCVPVLGILDWMEKLAPVLRPEQLLTDVGSTKGAICAAASKLFPADGTHACFLPGHPMAGKESGGAGLAEASLFDGATWIFTGTVEHAAAIEWRDWVVRMGAHTLDLDPTLHDKLCAWVSHLPQFVSTAMAALFEDEFGDSEQMRAVGGRALREMTRLGASPYSMWRDVAFTNTDAVAATLFALEQRLTHLRENLRTPELREEFVKANAFRRKRG